MNVVESSKTNDYTTIEVIQMTNNRGLKTRTAFSNSLRNDLSDELDKLNSQTKIPKSKLLDEAIELLLLKYKSKQ